MDAKEITHALGGNWTLLGYGVCPCPCHDDRKPSLKVRDDPNRPDGINLHCFSGCDWRDVKAALVKQGLLEPVNGDSYSGAPRHVSPAPAKKQDAEQRQRIEHALNIFASATKLRGTLGERYFIERRGLHIALLEDLHHCLRWREPERMIVALMTDAVTGAPCGIHRTFLNPDATKKERKMLGKFGVVCLSQEVTTGIGICEGIEDSLAVLLSGWSPVWCCAGACGIACFPPLDGVEHLTVFADNDPTGVAAAAACVKRWKDAGREARVISLKGFTDG